MDKKERFAILYGAAIYRDMDSEKVLAILNAADLNLETCTTTEAKAAIDAAYIPAPPPLPSHIFITYRTVAELSTRYRVPQNTIRAWLSADKIDHARKTDTGIWIVPERNFVLSHVYKRWSRRNPEAILQ